MAKQVMLAVAGAGKTYTVCHELNPDNKNLILAYTHENIHNINSELVASFGKIPELTNVMTYDSFIYRYILCPFEPTVLKKFNRIDFIKKGITTQRPPEMTNIINGRRFPNRNYKKKTELEHYEINGKYYCDTLAELVLFIDDSKEKFIDKVSECINMFYDQVCIDEFQDFRKYDFDFIISLSRKLNSVLLVGDYYQHSVSGDNNSGKPFDKMDLPSFVEFLKKNKFDVDTEKLKNSRRCPKEICDFIAKKLNIEFAYDNDNKGKIIWLDENNIQSVLQNDAIVKLVWSSAMKYSFNAINWSYSKGDTYDEVCVILTDTFKTLKKTDFDLSKITPITINKLYVALTRTRGNLYLATKDVFDKVKDVYLL